MYDKMEKKGKSLIQHGKYNDRVYLMKLYEEDIPGIIDTIDEISNKNDYSKIFAKAPRSLSEEFIKRHYAVEAEIPGFYNDSDDGLFLAKYLKEARKNLSEKDSSEIKNNIQLAENKKGSKKLKQLQDEYLMQKLKEEDLAQLADLYKIVFPTYPFPIHETSFLKEAMNDNVEFFGIKRKSDGKLIAASSAEKYIDYSNVEMTDFATNPDFLGSGLALYLLDFMEEEMIKQNFKTLYTIARSHSPGMNITFSKNDYEFGGTLINNTNIFGRIESMNIWYKKTGK